MAKKFKKSKNPILGSNNTRHLLALSLLMGNCISASEGAKLTNQDKMLLKLTNNVSKIALKRHPKSELDAIYEFIKDNATDTRHGSIEPLIAVDLIMLSLSQSKYQGFFGLSTPYVPSRKYTARDVGVFLSFLELLYREFNTKPMLNKFKLKTEKAKKVKRKKTSKSEEDILRIEEKNRLKMQKEAALKQKKKEQKEKKDARIKENKEKKKQKWETIMKLSRMNKNIKGVMSECCNKQLVATIDDLYRCPKCEVLYDVEFNDAY